MNKRTVLLICAALALAGAYLAFFIDWHNRPKIHIFWEKSRRAVMAGSEDPGVVFHLDKAYPLTSVEVVDAEDAQTNKHPHALWHVVASDAPATTSSFAYGGAIRGMKPQISTAEPEPLQPDTTYLLVVEAGKKLKGEISFQPPL